MPSSIPDDLAVRKVAESEDKAFVLRILAAAKTRLEQFDKKDDVPRDGKYHPLGNDTAANKGR